MFCCNIVNETCKFLGLPTNFGTKKSCGKKILEIQSLWKKVLRAFLDYLQNVSGKNPLILENTLNQNTSNEKKSSILNIKLESEIFLI